MDPFTIVTSWIAGVKIGSFLSDLVYGKNVSHLSRGQEYFSLGQKKRDFEFIKKAISEFDQIDENEDRLVVVACSYLYRAMCYTLLEKFSLTYYFLDKLEIIKYNSFTRKKDTIEEIKSEGRKFRIEVEKIESSISSDTNWQKVLIIFLVIIGGCITAATLYFFFF